MSKSSSAAQMFVNYSAEFPLTKIASVRLTVKSWRKIKPVRVRCSCGSRIWVSAASADWLLESFLDKHDKHDWMEVEQ